MVSDSVTAIVIISLLLLTLVVGLTAHAHAVKMDLMDWTIDKKPIICINEVHKFKYSTIKAVKLWNEFTNDPKWEIGISGNNCNVKVFELYNLEIDGTPGWGVTACTKQIGCVVILNASIDGVTNNLRTVAHEIGHVLSLGHFPDPEGTEETLQLGACQPHVMWWVAGCGYPLFSEGLQVALECRHTSDGWGGVTNYHCETLTWVKNTESA